jgi:Zn-dependent alcohol dehydrogenase
LNSAVAHWHNLINTLVEEWAFDGDEDGFLKCLSLLVNRIVESIGEGVTKVKAGDHVLPYCLGQCDHCYNCVNDLTNICKSRPLGWGVSTTLIGDPKPHFTTVDGTALNRLMAVSTFCEYTVVHEEHVVKLNPELDLENSCLLSCGVSTGMLYFF